MSSWPCATPKVRPNTFYTRVATQKNTNLQYLQDGKPNLLRILFRPVSPRYEANESGIATLSHGEHTPSVRVMEFTEDMASFVPVRMEVMEASDARGGVPARVCLLGKDEVTYKVFSLPEQAQLLQA